jgi:hypothetical protein
MMVDLREPGNLAEALDWSTIEEDTVAGRVIHYTTEM